MPSRDEFMDRFKEESAEPTRSFEGFSEFSDDTDETAFHRAMKKAAKAAAEAAREEATEAAGVDTTPAPEWYEVARVRVLVGNPNIKVLGVTITATNSGGGGS
jgi:hypothetical protein